MKDIKGFAHWFAHWPDQFHNHVTKEFFMTWKCNIIVNALNMFLERKLYCTVKCFVQLHFVHAMLV